jgi:mRNA interferase RelE/StbE
LGTSEATVGAVSYQIIIQPLALKQLQGISDRRIRDKILDRIDGLGENPEAQGKPLVGDLSRYHSVRAVGQRYRIIYKVDGSKVTVFVLTLGIRKDGDKQDVYTLAKKLLRLRLLDPPD